MPAELLAGAAAAAPAVGLSRSASSLVGLCGTAAATEYPEDTAGIGCGGDGGGGASRVTVNPNRLPTLDGILALALLLPSIVELLLYPAALISSPLLW
jgi:hypothetical protein